MGIYERLGVRPVINAAAAQTIIGGSLMSEPVLAAVHEAAQSFVSLTEFHDRVGERIAEITHNEAAAVTCGAAAGILVAAGACIVRDDVDRVTELPDLSGFRQTEFISWESQRNGFLMSVRETGATLVEIGQGEEDLEAAIGDRTAGIIWFAGTPFAGGALPLADVIRLGRNHAVPVIVDAADQVPPVTNLWKFTRDMGADLAIFSGGKGLGGPQSSGLVLGRADLVRSCRANGGPYQSIGRPAKVGKEELAGLLAAVEAAVTKDEAAESQRFSDVVDSWQRAFSDLPGMTTERVAESHIGQPIPRLVLRSNNASALTRDEIIARLWDQSPRIAVLPFEEDAIALNPHLLSDGDAERVVSGIFEAAGAGLDRPL
ncbi:MAG TPA: aminotransferase class V-fold PLP-dependent enzyme [Thermomicrobiales bacterium]|nr:aminotransferase class V-fold PLP-dependent enzyme [Thermomicrobiales bacterium]